MKKTGIFSVNRKHCRYNAGFVLFLLFAVNIFSQFKPDFIPKIAREKDQFPYLNKEARDSSFSRLSHSQSISTSFYSSRGYPAFSYAYTNMFGYKLMNRVNADLKIHVRHVKNAHNDLQQNSLYGAPHLAGSAGIEYSLTEKGIFSLNARTFHDPAWSGQAAYISMFGIPIKKLYKSKSFDSYGGPPLDY